MYVLCVSIRPEEGGVGYPEAEITGTCKLLDVGAANRTLEEQGMLLNHRPVSLVLLRIRIVFKNTLMFYPKENFPGVKTHCFSDTSLTKLWDLIDHTEQ